jgi:hypothetical protein
MCRTSAVKAPNEGDDADDDADDGGRAPLRRTVPIGKRAKIDAMHVVFLQVTGFASLGIRRVIPATWRAM